MSVSMDLHSSDAGAFLLPWPHVGVKFTWPTTMHAHNMNTANNNRDRMMEMDVATVYNIIMGVFFLTVELFADSRTIMYNIILYYMRLALLWHERWFSGWFKVDIWLCAAFNVLCGRRTFPYMYIIIYYR